MENTMELQQIVYSVLKTQISFGVYRFGEQLPTMDEACRLFGVSIKTIRAAYQQLQQDGLIKISKNIGARVTSDYSSEDIRQNVREFFSCRRRSLIDLNHSTWLLLSEAQLTAFKKASGRLLEEPCRYISSVFSPQGSTKMGWRSLPAKRTTLSSMEGQ